MSGGPAGRLAGRLIAELAHQVPPGLVDPAHEVGVELAPLFGTSRTHERHVAPARARLPPGVALGLFESLHPGEPGRLDGGGDAFGRVVEAQVVGGPDQRTGRVGQHVLVTEQQERRVRMAGAEPTADVLAPVAEAPPLRPAEAGDIVVDRAVGGEIAVLDLVVVVRDRDITRVADDIHDAAAAGVETVVGLQDPRSRQGGQGLVVVGIDVGQDRVEPAQRHRFIRMHEAGQHVAEPGIAGLRVGDDEAVVVPDPDLAKRRHCLTHDRSGLPGSGRPLGYPY